MGEPPVAVRKRHPINNWPSPHDCPSAKSSAPHPCVLMEARYTPSLDANDLNDSRRPVRAASILLLTHIVLIPYVPLVPRVPSVPTAAELRSVRPPASPPRRGASPRHIQGLRPVPRRRSANRIHPNPAKCERAWSGSCCPLRSRGYQQARRNETAGLTGFWSKARRPPVFLRIRQDLLPLGVGEGPGVAGSLRGLASGSSS